ncbi:MAG: hypothetical protein IMX01_08985 [Limnochordaceae bacterium]|nr:hypothetical protein [Limnochordaceae bacterium]
MKSITEFGGLDVYLGGRGGEGASTGSVITDPNGGPSYSYRVQILPEVET